MITFNIYEAQYISTVVIYSFCYYFKSQNKSSSKYPYCLTDKYLIQREQILFSEYTLVQNKKTINPKLW